MKNKLTVVFYVTLLVNIILYSVKTTISIYAVEQGATILEVGYLASINALLPLLFAIIIGKYVDRYGSNFFLKVGSLLILIASLLLFSQVFFVLCIANALFGLSQVMVAISSQNAVGVVEEGKQRNFASLTLYLSLGQLLGPIISGLLLQWTGFYILFMIHVVLALCTCVLLLVLLNKKSSFTSNSSPKYRLMDSMELLKISKMPAYILISAFSILFREIFVVFFPLYGIVLGLSAIQIAMIISAQTAGMIGVRFFLKFFITKFQLYPFARLLIGFVSAIMILLGIGSSVFLLIMLSFLMGIAIGILQPVSMILVDEISPEERKAEIVGLKLAINRLFLLAIPTLLGMVSAVVGVHVSFILTGITSLGWFAVSFKERKR
ncbi:MFS transporter [Psychrobacillus sp. NPDC096389]|uniref:MFS transporter n=1 Tax=Psychrobacillus sp. NPDC096389 TaxID=3364490 RepID=UPI003811D212